MPQTTGLVEPSSNHAGFANSSSASAAFLLVCNKVTLGAHRTAMCVSMALFACCSAAAVHKSTHISRPFRRQNEYRRRWNHTTSPRPVAGFRMVVTAAKATCVLRRFNVSAPRTTFRFVIECPYPSRTMQQHVRVLRKRPDGECL